MKTLNKIVLVTMLSITPILIGSGCGSTPVTTANKANAIVITSVNAGMTLWKDYVNSGKATQAQINAVKSFYTTYYNAELAVKAALELSISTTNSNAADMANVNASVASAEKALLDILNQYLNK